MKSGKVGARPELLASFAILASVALAATTAVALRAIVHGPRRFGAIAEAAAATGVLMVLASGLANWAFGVQGYVMLFERSPTRLDRPDASASITLGPLARRGDLAVTIALGRLRLLSAGRDGFAVESRLRVLDAAGEEVGLDVARGRPGSHGDLVYRQGVFGFAPHLVVTQVGRTVYDAVVPFRTIREGGAGIAFMGDVKLPAQRLELHGALTLEDLNDDMKGHPRLEVAVEREGAVLGAGSLRPGERAAVGEGYAVAFVGLQRWSEIDVARRTRPAPLLAGFALALLGGAAWAMAAWRRW